jgi:hypothetical protein
MMVNQRQRGDMKQGTEDQRGQRKPRWLVKPLMLFNFLIVLGCTQAAPLDKSDTAAVDRDNTANNVRDAAEHAKTPVDHGSSARDVEITAEIRKRVVELKISVNGQNVKIITQNGQVTLRGPVKSEDEKNQIEKVAADVAGDANVESLLEVETNP